MSYGDLTAAGWRVPADQLYDLFSIDPLRVWQSDETGRLHWPDAGEALTPIFTEAAELFNAGKPEESPPYAITARRGGIQYSKGPQ